MAGEGEVTGKWALKKWCVPILYLIFVSEEAFLSGAGNFHGEFETSSPHERSRSFPIDFKGSIIRPRIIKINPFKQQTL